MRKEVGNLELDQLFLEREKLNIGIAQALDEASQPWGIRVFRYEIADIHVDRGTREAMEKQSNAERLRRAEVLESEGYRQKLINQSEGERQGAHACVARVNGTVVFAHAIVPQVVVTSRPGHSSHTCARAEALLYDFLR